MAFNPEVFIWARETAGFELDAAARAMNMKSDTLRAIEDGSIEPSHAVLSKMARKYHRSLLTFYLPAPPRKGDRGEDFRTVAHRSAAVDASVDALVRDLRARQSLVRSILEDDEDAQPLAFVGSGHMDNGVAVLVRRIEQLLGMTRAEYRNQKDVQSAFKVLRKCVEKAGVFVLLVGDLGSHHSAIAVDAFRGFAIADDLAPFIVINDNDAKVAWSFTLLHELAHLWLNATGLSAAGVPQSAIERFCNEVAAEFLLPSVEIASLSVVGLNLEAQTALITAHASGWHVSRQMLAYGLYKAGRISLENWQTLDAHIREIWSQEKLREKQKRKPDSGVSYYVTRRHRLGDALLGFARQYMQAGTLTPSEASRVLRVKPRAVWPLLTTSV